jgi:hypothetical protein
MRSQPFGVFAAIVGCLMHAPNCSADEADRALVSTGPQVALSAVTAPAPNPPGTTAAGDSPGASHSTPAPASVSVPPLESPRHLALFFSYQRIGLNRLNRAHTFATFARVSGSGPSRTVETETISWYPSVGKGEPGAAFSRPELRALAGRNKTLSETLADAREGHCRITMWGPFEIKPELFDRARLQARRLETEGCRWQALDRKHRLDCQAFNCIHAVSDLDLGPGMLKTHFFLGESATRKVVCHLRRWFVGCPVDGDWLIDHLGVRCEALDRAPRSIPDGCRLDYESVPCCWRRQVPYLIGPSSSPVSPAIAGSAGDLSRAPARSDNIMSASAASGSADREVQGMSENERAATPISVQTPSRSHTGA